MRLDEIKARAAAATPVFERPTHSDHGAEPEWGKNRVSYVFHQDEVGYEIARFTHLSNHRADANFYARAKTDIDWLIARLEQAEKVVEYLIREALRRYLENFRRTSAEVSSSWETVGAGNGKVKA